MSTIDHTTDRLATTARGRTGLSAVLRGWRDICVALGQAVADILDPSLHRFPTSAPVVADVARWGCEPTAATISQPATRPDDGQIVWEVRRLLALSGRTLADVVRTLETQAVGVDGRARDLLQDELHALDMDLATLKVLLSDPVDWDSEYGRLLADDVAPFDDDPGEDDDDAE